MYSTWFHYLKLYFCSKIKFSAFIHHEFNIYETEYTSISFHQNQQLLFYIHCKSALATGNPGVSFYGYN